MSRMERSLLTFVVVFACLFLETAFGTDISTFTDAKCTQSYRDINGPNGYPNGTCTQLRAKGSFNSFMVTSMDPGCTVTIYANDTTPDVCSATVLQFAEEAVCYNTSWIYYSIDACTPPQDIRSTTRSALPSSTFTTSTSSSSSYSYPTSPALPGKTTKPASSSHIAALVGGVVGGVAIACTLIAFAIFYFYRRRARRAYPKTPPKGPDPPELADNGLAEIEPEIVQPRYELTDSSIKRAELPSGVEGKFDSIKLDATLDGASELHGNQTWIDGEYIPHHPAVPLKEMPSPAEPIIEEETRSSDEKKR